VTLVLMFFEGLELTGGKMIATLAHRRWLPINVVFFLAVGIGLGRPGCLLADQVGLSVGAAVSAATGGVPSSSQSFSATLSPSPIVVNPLSASVSFSEPGISSSASGTGSGTVNFGAITGSVSTTGVESAPSLPFGMNVNDTSASGVFDGFWQDSIIVTSNTLAAGTPVNLLFTMDVNAALSCTGPNASVQAVAGLQAGLSQILMSSSTCNSTLAGSKTLLLQTTVGADIPVEGQLDLTAVASGVNGIASTGNIDPPSSEFFVDSLTAGASYTTLSGTTYFSPTTSVPEPSSLALFGLGILPLLAISAKRKLNLPKLSHS
jgi:hypothetical protein